MLIQDTYKKHNIEIPFPIRTIDFNNSQTNLFKEAKAV